MTWGIFLGLVALIADRFHDYFSCPVLRTSIGSVGWLLYIRLSYCEDKATVYLAASDVWGKTVFNVYYQDMPTRIWQACLGWGNAIFSICTLICLKSCNMWCLPDFFLIMNIGVLNLLWDGSKWLRESCSLTKSFNTDNLGSKIGHWSYCLFVSPLRAKGCGVTKLKWWSVVIRIGG